MTHSQLFSDHYYQASKDKPGTLLGELSDTGNLVKDEGTQGHCYFLFRTMNFSLLSYNSLKLRVVQLLLNS